MVARRPRQSTDRGLESELRRSGSELCKRSCDLCLDVEHRLALTGAAFVAREHKLADLGGKTRVLVGPSTGRGFELGELSVDVKRRLALADEAIAAGLQHLANLLLALADIGGPAHRSPACHSVFADRQTALTDLVVEAAAGEHREDAEEDKQRNRPKQHYRENGMHREIVAHRATLRYPLGPDAVD